MCFKKNHVQIHKLTALLLKSVIFLNHALIFWCALKKYTYFDVLTNLLKHM